MRLQSALEATARQPVPFSSDTSAPFTTDVAAAAVLIAITDRKQPGLILTQRPDTMRRHAGQVAFPGGRVDPDDADDVAAALREAHEEIDLPPYAVTVIGTLGRYRTITGYDIAPVLGVIAPDLVLTPHDAEVAAVFEVPLSYLFDPANIVERQITIEGRVRQYREIMWENRRIWGATAAMLANLAARLA